MQLRVTVALATVWFTVAGLVGGTLRLSNDQYSPASPNRYAELQRDQTQDWRAHGPAEDQPLDLWIGSQRSISAEELKASHHNTKFAEKDFSLEKPLKDIVSSKRVSLSSWQKRLPNIATTEFAADKVDYGYEMPETLSREAIVPRSDLLDDPFVADDTFQDQGPGSMEIYKLDLSKEKTMFTATTPATNLPSRNKSKPPKKTSHLNLKTKTTEIKSTTIDPKVHHKQSNFFEEQRTETPLVNRDAFGVGGVPELQVGCEGLEASPSSHKAKRSIDTSDKEKGVAPASELLDMMPISLDLDYNLSYDEENYEEMDELFRLKKLETATKSNKPKRGDMDASYLNSDHLDESRDKLPVRGDMGESIARISRLETDREKSQKSTDHEIKKGTKTKRALSLSNDAVGNRRLLWLAEANTQGFADGKDERKRARRSANWGFGENEGVVSSDELQTVNERRRQHEMRYHQDVSRRRDQNREVNPDVDSIRREYENLLEQKRREEEEERLQRMQQRDRKTLNKWEEEERRRDEMRKTEHDKYRNRMDHTSTPRMDDEETRQRHMKEKQKQEIARSQTQDMIRRQEEEQRRFKEYEEQRRQLQEGQAARKKPYNNKWKEERAKRPEPKIESKKPYNNKWKEENAKRPESETESNEDRRQRLHNEETRRREEERQRQLQREEAWRREQYRFQQEAQKRKEEEERRRQEDHARNLSEDDRRRLEERRREWSEKKRQQEEAEARRQQPPSNLMREGHRNYQPNDVRQRDRDEEKRMREQEEREREQKLREYIARNQPINVTHADPRSEETRRRYRPEESRDPRINARRDDEDYRAKEQRRREEEERKLQDYIRRNQPINVPSRSNQSSTPDRNLLEERRQIEEARRRDRDRYPDSGARRHHGPSAPTYNIDRRVSPEEVRQRQQETERRLKEERRQRYEAEERRKELARRQREEEERRLREERMREEALRREEETRKTQSRRYEEDRKRLEAIKLQTERRRQEMLKERDRSRSEAGRIRQPEATRPTYSESSRPAYQNPRLLEHRRRQDSQPIPSNLVREEEARRAAAEREKQKLEAERRRQNDSRMRDHKPKETEPWKRQELARLNSLPVSARIIVLDSSPISPVVVSRTNFNNEIDFTGINPHRQGIQAPKFPVPPTSRPPAQNPGPCIWAIVQCCSPNNNRLVKCFESMGCPGVNWDPNPCRGTVAAAARAEVMKFYNASNQ